MWEGYPKLSVLQKTLDGARKLIERSVSPWNVATDPAAVFVLTLRRIGWDCTDARKVITDRGEELDLLRIAPRMVAHQAELGVARWTDRRAMQLQFKDSSGSNLWNSDLFWSAMRGSVSGRVSSS